MGEVKKTKASEERAKHNAKVEELNNQLDIVAQKFIDNPQPFFKEREKEVAKIIEKYGNLQIEGIENGNIARKDYATQLSKYLIKPLINYNGKGLNHTAQSVSMVNQWYWENIVLKANEKVQFIPSIYHVCKLLNISKDTLNRYATDGDPQMREVCAMIRDEFIDYYQQKGLTKELNDIMAMFILKTSYGQRENDQPQIAVVNVNNSPDEKISKYARQKGFEVWREEE